MGCGLWVVGCGLWYSWGREWQVVMKAFESTFSIMVSRNYLILIPYAVLTRLDRCYAQRPNSKRHALDIKILVLISLKILGQQKSRLTKICHQCVEGGCSYDCAGAAVTAGLVSFAPELLCVARSPLMQCFRIQGCFCTSVRGMRFSGSSTSNFRNESAFAFIVHVFAPWNLPFQSSP